MAPLSQDDSIEKKLSMKKISRRDFLGWLIRGGLTVTLGGMLMPALTYLWPVTRQGPAGGLKEVAKTEDIPIGGSKKVIVGGSAILILRTADGFKAFSAICTHLGCLVAWNGQKQIIECPCHAGSFDGDGQVVAGPPPRALPPYQVSVIDDKVFVKV